MGAHRSAATEAFERLVGIMRILRGPQGCPWDRQQDVRSLRRYVLEESYEVVQAIDDGDPGELAGELGDLLLQVVFLSQIASEAGQFDIEAVITRISDKLVRRHPHVFSGQRVETSEEVLHRWEMMKLQERGGGSVLDDMPAALPALARAEKLGRRSAQLSFDWPGVAEVMAKVREELTELSGVLQPDTGGESPQAASGADIEAELGDLLFAVANLARHLGLSAEVALRHASDKFERRFRSIEPQIVAGKVSDPEAMDQLWEQVKGR
ncbi:MAG: nucleoside triphosphate pyrophosphohydrolase [Acidobacteriota bacterium]